MIEIEKFKDIVNDLEISLVSDSEWPTIANNLVKGLEVGQKMAFWTELEGYFKQTEPSREPFHKGQIYWQLALLNFSKDKLPECINCLKLAKEEDTRAGRPRSSAKDLLGVVGPLYDKIETNNEIKNDFLALSQNEEFELFEWLRFCHDTASLGSKYVIGDDFWGFVLSDSRREICKKQYIEVREILKNRSLELDTYCSIIFTIGSISEAFVDDILVRNDKYLINNYKELHPRARTSYFGDKINIIRTSVDNGNYRLSRTKIILLAILQEYRNLIHNSNLIDFKYQTNKYIAVVLFAFLASIANDMWEDNYNLAINNNV